MEYQYLVKAKFWGKYLLKSKWLFVHAIITAGAPSFGKALFTRTLHNILNEINVENFDIGTIVLFLAPFIFIPLFGC